MRETRKIARTPLVHSTYDLCGIAPLHTSCRCVTTMTGTAIGAAPDSSYRRLPVPVRAFRIWARPSLAVGIRIAKILRCRSPRTSGLRFDPLPFGKRPRHRGLPERLPQGFRITLQKVLND